MEMEQFKASLGQKLESLKATRHKVKVWVMDEARFGLHTDLHRVWMACSSPKKWVKSVEQLAQIKERAVV